MNVLVVVDTRPDYSEPFIRLHIDRLATSVVALRELSADVERFRWRARRKLFRALNGAGYDEARNEAVSRAFRERLRHHRPDLVLAQYGTVGVRIFEACRSEGVPLVVCFRGYDASKSDVLEQFASLYQEMFSAVGRILVVARRMAAKLEDLGAPAEKIRWSPTGVDVERFSPVEAVDNPPTLLAVGRFVEKKAPHLTVAAFREVVRHVPDARLRIIGDGKLLEATMQLSRAWGLSDRIEFPGSVPHDTVAEEMRLARAFVQHSVTAPDGDSEGTPNSILEAGASGLPTVSTRHSGIPEAVIDGRTGILVDEYDVDGMARAMICLLTDPALARQMGLAARAHVEREYSQVNLLVRLRGILREAIDEAAVGVDR